MKMTGLEWRYLQRIALDHPYFDTHKLPLTEKEAKAIVAANIKMTGKEFVDSIYVKLGMTRPQEEKKHFTWLRNIGELFTVPPVRKIAITVLVIVLMTVFFAATPTGRAIAESVIHYIATLFKDGRLVVNQSDNETLIVPLEINDDDNRIELQEGQPDFVYVDSFYDFSVATRKTPVILPVSYVELCFYRESDIDYLVFYATYETSKGNIETYQVWGADDAISSTMSGFTAYDLDESIYYSIEEEGKIIIKKIFSDSFLGISAQGHFTLEELIEMIK